MKATVRFTVRFTVKHEAFRSKAYDTVVTIVTHNRLITDRLAELKAIGVDAETVVCGAGGVKQIVIKGDNVFVQIAAGVGNYNYAEAVKIGTVVDGHFVQEPILG